MVKVDGFIQRALVLNTVLLSVIVLPLNLEGHSQLESFSNLNSVSV